MKKLFILVLMVAPFVFASYHKPSFRTHQEKIYFSAKGADPAIDEEFFDRPEWEDLSFVDWFIFTSTRDKKLSTLVSIGLIDRVFVVDGDWAPTEFKLKPEVLR